jgi:hypothetical protein
VEPLPSYIRLGGRIGGVKAELSLLTIEDTIVIGIRIEEIDEPITIIISVPPIPPVGCLVAVIDPILIRIRYSRIGPVERKFLHIR